MLVDIRIISDKNTVLHGLTITASHVPTYTEKTACLTIVYCYLSYW